MVDQGMRDAILEASPVELDIIDLMLDRRADPNVRLQAACLGGFEDTAATLLENGANPNAMGAGYYGTPLLAACFNGHLAIVKMLLKRGVDPNRQDGRYGKCSASSGS